jgi:hypothetical protein
VLANGGALVIKSGFENCKIVTTEKMFEVLNSNFAYNTKLEKGRRTKEK